MISRKTILVLTTGGLMFVLGVWLAAWWFASDPGQLSQITQQPTADIFSSVNALFAGLAFGGVIITVYIQVRELQDTRDELKKTADSTAETAKANAEMAKANMEMVSQAKEQAILGMFQTYCSDYFQTVKDSSMSVLIPCAASSEYLDFVASRFFVVEQLPLPASCWDKVSKVSYCKTYEEFAQMEQRYRYKLDELINFFTLLAGKENSKDIIARCDFSYSWWRPLFWMIATLQHERYHASPAIQQYGTPLYFPDVVRKLDEIYQFEPFASHRDAWHFIVNHPKVKSYGIDPTHLRRCA